jgi:hypothetical protein
LTPERAVQFPTFLALLAPEIVEAILAGRPDQALMLGQIGEVAAG